MVSFILGKVSKILGWTNDPEEQFIIDELAKWFAGFEN